MLNNAIKNNFGIPGISKIAKMLKKKNINYILICYIEKFDFWTNQVDNIFMFSV